MRIIKTQFSNFFHFVRTQGVAGFAIGFILGRAISDLVGSLVNDIINPVISILLGRFADISKLAVTVAGSTISYGKFLSLLINFIVIAAVVYFGIKKLSELFDRPKDAPPQPSVPTAPGIQNK